MINITSYKAINKGNLVGIFSFEVIKWGNFFIRNAKFFQKGNQQWISMPDKEYEQDGQKKYAPQCGFADREMDNKFKAGILKELIEYIKANPPQPEEKKEEGIPF